MLVLTFSLPLLQLSFLSEEIPQDMAIINDKNHLRSSVPCLQASLYRSLWVVYQVHRPPFTGCPSGLGNQVSCKVISLSLQIPQQVPSLPISHYRLLFIKNLPYIYFSISYVYLELFSSWRNCHNKPVLESYTLVKLLFLGRLINLELWGQLLGQKPIRLLRTQSVFG